MDTSLNKLVEFYLNNTINLLISSHHHLLFFKNSCQTQLCTKFIHIHVDTPYLHDISHRHFTPTKWRSYRDHRSCDVTTSYVYRASVASSSKNYRGYDYIRKRTFCCVTAAVECEQRTEQSVSFERHSENYLSR